MKHSTHLSLWITVVVILVVASGLAAFAGTYRSPSKDMYCLVSSACVNGYGISSNASLPSCNSTQVGYIGWNLSSITTQIEQVKLTLTTTYVTGAPAGPLTFSLLVPNSQDWTEATVTDPGVGAVVATGTATLVNQATGGTAQTVTFGGPDDPVAAIALGTYFEGLRSGANPDSATIAVRVSGGCTQSSFVTFAERGSAGETDLVLYPQDVPLAVTLSTFRAADSAVNWPLIAGLGALVVLGAGGALWYRRRATTH